VGLRRLRPFAVRPVGSECGGRGGGGARGLIALIAVVAV
jgi:hypothetical protein